MPDWGTSAGYQEVRKVSGTKENIDIAKALKNVEETLKKIS